MKRFPAALAVLLAAPSFSAASLPDFTVPDDPLAAIRTSVRTQQWTSQRANVMGSALRAAALADDTASAAPDVTAYSVRGIDISHYDGAIDWNAVAMDGLSFVYIKATEGGDVVDAQFQNNWAGAAKAGLARGAYHFYNFCKDGADQADNFIKTVPVTPGALPPTIDLEQSTDCTTMPEKTAFLAQLSAFVQKIQNVYGAAPILYVNASIYDQYLSGVADAYKLWIADVSHAAPVMPNAAPWTMWQYNWHGQVVGIPDEVDLDVFNGTPAQLAALQGTAAGESLASAK